MPQWEQIIIHVDLPLRYSVNVEWFKHYANEYEHVTKVNRELDAIDMQKKTDAGESHVDQSSGPEIEGPVVIEFQAEPEDEDDEDNNDFHI